MKYFQSRINDYREMELVSIIQSQIAEPLWYYFDVALTSPNRSTDNIDNKFINIPSINQFVSNDNQDIAIYTDDRVCFLLGYSAGDFENRLNNLVIIERKSEIILWVSMSEPNYNGINIDVSTSNSRIYQSDEEFDYFDYSKESLIEALDAQGNFYMDIKRTCLEAIDVAEKISSGHANDFEFILSKNKCKIKNRFDNRG